MRIISGAFRGQSLAALGKGDAAAHLRPTTDRVRENLFNVLNGGRYGDPISGARVLDLFAGTGALGLEALSRGAAHTCFVENGRKAQQLISQNITLCKCADQTELMRRDATRLPANAHAPYDLLFLDPPYGKGMGEKALSHAISGYWIAEAALIVWEESVAVDVPEGLTLLETRAYGGTNIHILEKD